MKGEHIIAELIGLVALLAYGVMLQHIFSQMDGHPEASWVNQLRAWWLTRNSRSRERILRKVWDSLPEEP